MGLHKLCTHMLLWFDDGARALIYIFNADCKVLIYSTQTCTTKQ